MTQLILSFAATAAALTFWEIVKQIGVRAAQAYAPPVVAAGLKELDRLLPQLIADGVSGAELEDRLRQRMTRLTGSDWQRIRSRFDPAIFLDAQLHE